MRRPRAVAALALAGLLAGCGLPLPRGVEAARQVPEERPRGGAVVVLPPGPAPDASPREVVTGFLAAQSSPEGDHAVARQFLAPGVEWDTSAGVQVYDESAAPVPAQTEGSDVVTVVSRRVAQVEADGGYRRAQEQGGEEITDTYTVGCGPGPCRITGLPAGYGLRLSARDLSGAFAPRSVHFLAPTSGEATAAAHLVADQVWLPRADLALELVTALLRGPSSALDGSVRTAVPPGTTARSVRADPDGTVTVDLSEQVAALDPVRREQLSAQLVWTLRGLESAFTALRLRVEGRALEVGGRRAAQPATAWAQYTPERLRARASALYVEDRQLRALDGGLSASAATDGRQPVDTAAASPDGFLALLTERRDGAVELRTGPQTGPFDDVRLVGDLSSPTWGSGEQGLWLLRAGELVLVPPSGGALVARVQGLSGDGPVRRVQAARDGVRVALLVGPRDRQRLLVGRLVQGGDRPEVTGLRQVVPGLGDVTDVAWETGTTLVALARFPFGRVPARVAVDGSTVAVSSSRLPQDLDPVSVTAAAERPVVLAGTTRGGSPSRLYRDDGQVFDPADTGASPAYPG